MAGPMSDGPGHHQLSDRLCGLVEDAFDLAPVEVDFPSYRALTVTGLVPGLYRLFQVWRCGQWGRASWLAICGCWLARVVGAGLVS